MGQHFYTVEHIKNSPKICKNYPHDIYSLIHSFICSFHHSSLPQEFWVTGGKLETTITIIEVVESIALAVGSEFKIYLKELIPMILKSCINDSKEKQVTAKV